MQLWQTVRLGSKLIKEHSIEVVHARSMIPATMGLLLKKMYGVKLLFDIRGFAIDEKVDSGRLKKSSVLYKILKKMDDHLYIASDHIVTLTYTAKKILQDKLSISSEKITVIPTCASKEVFKLLGAEECRVFKNALGYANNDKIILHTGTVSLWYDFENEIKLVKEMIRQDEDINFLVLNKNEQTYIQQMFDKYEMPKERVKILSSSFDEVHKYLNIADASLFFIKPSFSKQASSPTKFAENVACQLPSITNGNVGDMGYYLERYEVGEVVDLEMLDEKLGEASENALKLMSSQIDNEAFIILFDEHFDKDMAVKKYNEIYIDLVGIK
jgi:glycosyltransferase involved in cell wall biosynthesis